MVQPANIQFPWSDSRIIPELVRGTENDDMHTNRLSCQCAYNSAVWDSTVEDFSPPDQSVSLSPADSTKAFLAFFLKLSIQKYFDITIGQYKRETAANIAMC